MKILLLEDSKLDADLTIRKLKAEINDCKIDVAVSVSDALKLLVNNYEVALIDYMLPDGYGTELLQEFVVNKKQTVLIMLTGTEDDEVAMSALKLGARDYIIKEGEYLDKLIGVISFHIKKKVERDIYFNEIINVLYLDYQQEAVELTKEHFKRYALNFRFKFVKSASEMLDILPNSPSNKSDYQIILIDYNIPGLSAIGLSKIIRQERKLEIPIIITTGQGCEEVAIKALNLGVNDYIVKRDHYLNQLPYLMMSSFHKYKLEVQNRKLLESEQRFRHIFDYANIGKAIVGFDGKLLKVNPMLCSMLEEDESELENKFLFDYMFSKDVLTVKNDYFFNRYKEPLHKDIEIKLIKNNKKLIWTSLTISLVKSIDKVPLYFILHIRDITVRKEAIEKNRQLSISVEQSPAIVMITDLNGQIEYVNRAFTEVTGYSKNEVIGKNPRILKSGEMKLADYEILWKTIKSGKVWKGEFLNRKKDGTLYWESTSISPLQDEKGIVTHFVAVKLDVTDKKRSLERIRKLNEKLEERVKERTKKLHEANQKLEVAIRNAESANKAKSEFLANMSHEIRTPMNAVLGFADLLDRQISNPLQKGYIQSIKSSGRTLLGIINDILDLAKIESGRVQLHPSPINFIVLMQEIEDMFRLKAIEKGLQFSIGIDNKLPHQIMIDELRLKQVLMNLISNAIKFTQKGFVKVNVGILSMTNDSADIRFCVQDSGIGITHEGLLRILKPFEQQEGQDDKFYGGTGLGLAISDKILMLHDSKIQIKSKVGEGSSFSFVLKDVKFYKNEILKPVQRIVDTESVDFIGQKVFVVDDDKENRDLITGFLHQYNLKVEQIENGEIAVKRIVNEMPDFVFMDLRMPKLDGIEAVKIIRRKLKDYKIPIALLTASVFHQKDEILKIFNGYLTKPLMFDQVIELLCQFLEHKKISSHHVIEKYENNISNVFKNSDLRKLFIEEFKLVLTSINTRRANKEIKQLAIDLQSFGRLNDLSVLVELGKELEMATISYNIEKILKILNILNSYI
ncbi:response regulator [Carboxylicivirga caseinilyticus]|uniref:response regulator n=1 Tax=Carboxylicivirga caseinilyticus TaxID=3417572 RepID=UPI003D327F6D|nr:response regulator [Marinilabiliaceae bacterium A049]